jgi:5'(3')-deoxyribonucleotidase
MAARKSIAVDMDEVIADALTEHLTRYNSEFGECLCVADLQGRTIWDAVPAERLSVLEGYIRSDDFFSELAVLPDAQRVLEALQQRYDVFIASALPGEVPLAVPPLPVHSVVASRLLRRQERAAHRLPDR